MTVIKCDAEDLRPLVTEILRQTLTECHHLTEGNEPRLAWSEADAAKLVGMQRWQLRDRRLEGQVLATKVGRSWFYTKEELMKLFTEKRRA